jgi:hypothetical protein
VVVPVGCVGYFFYGCGIDMFDAHVKELLERQKNKCIRVLLGAKERELDEYLPAEVQVAYRKIVLDQVNAFHEFCVDLFESQSEGTVVVNELFLNKLEEISNGITELIRG